MKNITIDTNLLPEMWLTWTTTKGVFYLNCQTGRKQNNAPIEASSYNRKCPRRIISSGSKPRIGYAKYHEDIDRLELAEVTIETTRKEEVKKWKYVGNRYFLGKDKSVVDENGNIVTHDFYLSEYHRSHDFKGFLGMFYRIESVSNVSEFKKLLGSDTYTVGSGRVVTVIYAWHIQEWYRTSQKVKGAGKQQKLVDKLVAMPLSDVSQLAKQYPMTKNSYGRYDMYDNGIMYFERLTDGWSVLRLFDRYHGSNDLREKERMYLHDDGTNRIVTPGKDKWVPARQMYTYSTYRLVNIMEAMRECKRLKYILPLLADVDKRQFRMCLMTVLRFPEIEQMMNLGYRNKAKKIAYSNTPRADLKDLFGGYYNEKGKTFLRKVGMTKYQTDKFMQDVDPGYYSHSSTMALREMRKIFSEDLSHVDNTTFNKYYNAFSKMSFGYRGSVYPQLDSMDIDRAKFIKNVIRLSEKNENAPRIINDTLNQYRGLNIGTHPEINWYFDDYSDVIRAHDAIDELKRTQDAERRALWDMETAKRLAKEEEKRIKMDEKRKEYEYEDEQYVIRLPKDLNEIITEGSKQRICIGGYTSRHATGKTNLFFIRKKSEPNVPFYAIEMDNNKTVVQIHGYGNSWLGNNPEVIPTVVRWARKSGIKCSERILTCTARGYSAINNYVPMPVVD